MNLKGNLETQTEKSVEFKAKCVFRLFSVHESERRHAMQAKSLNRSAHDAPYICLHCAAYWSHRFSALTTLVVNTTVSFSGGCRSHSQSIFTPCLE